MSTACFCFGTDMDCRTFLLLKSIIPRQFLPLSPKQN